MKKLIAILLVTVMVLTLVACTRKDSLVGTWEGDIPSELEKQLEMILNINGMEALSFSYKYELTFNKDGTGRLDLNMIDEGIAALTSLESVTSLYTDSFTYTIDDDKLTLSSTLGDAADEYEYMIVNDRLILKADGSYMTFNRK